MSLWDQIFGVRVPEEHRPLIVIDFERSGVDSGTIGYTIQVARVRNLSDADFQELLETIESLKDACSLSGDHQN